MELLSIVVIAIAFIFAFINGFHDGGNVFATAVSSRSVSPRKALLVSSLSEFIIPVLGGTVVAATIGKGVVGQSYFLKADMKYSMSVILCALLSAIVWNIITWKFGLPSSSSHALIGGLIGSGICAFGFISIQWGILLTKVIVMLLLTPFIGFMAGMLIMNASKKILHKFNSKFNNVLKKLHFLSIILLAGSHGTADAQKTMGIITMVLLISKKIDGFYVADWVKIGSSAALAIGLLFSGWKIILTVGGGIYKMEARHSLNAQIASAAVIYTSAALGGAVSTSQIVSSTIMGVGTADKYIAVKWSVAKNIFLSWILTVPSSAALSVLFFMIVRVIL
jgi:Phosphate/sulphate permeases